MHRDVSLPLGIVLRRMTLLSSTGFSLCAVNGPQPKPHRVKPALLDHAGLAPSLLAVKPAENFHEVLVRNAGWNLVYVSVRPPSTTMTWPVMKGDCARKMTVPSMSSGPPVRRSGARRMKSSAISGASPGNEIVPARWHSQ